MEGGSGRRAAVPVRSHKTPPPPRPIFCFYCWRGGGSNVWLSLSQVAQQLR